MARFTFRRRSSGAPMLPPAGGSTGSNKLARFSGGARAVAGRFSAGARKAGGFVKHKSAAAIAAHARARESGSDTLGAIFARQTGPGIAAVVAGTIDGTAAGQQFKAMTRGLMEPSTALAILGMGARGWGLDRKYLGRHITRGNTAFLTAKVPIVLYNVGKELPGWIGRRYQAMSSPGSGSPRVSGPAEQEAVPGEITVS